MSASAGKSSPKSSCSTQISPLFQGGEVRFRRELTVAGAPEDLQCIADFVDATCEESGVDPAARFDLQLAVEEACCNIMEHAYRGEGGGFSLCFEANDSDVQVTLHDHGRSFDPDKIGGPDIDQPLEDRPIGGLGLHLMRQLMDEVRFLFSERDGNTLAMVKRNIIRG